MKVFENVEKSPSISAIKGYFGHTFGAAGAI
jgi:3-oxoacyl-(acyl-carrier-protein) synthase